MAVVPTRSGVPDHAFLAPRGAVSSPPATGSVAAALSARADMRDTCSRMTDRLRTARTVSGRV